MPGMSLPGTAALSFGAPAASLPEKKKGGKVLFVYFLLTYTHARGRTHTHRGPPGKSN